MPSLRARVPFQSVVGFDQSEKKGVHQERCIGINHWASFPRRNIHLEALESSGSTNERAETTTVVEPWTVERARRRSIPVPAAAKAGY